MAAHERPLLDLSPSNSFRSSDGAAQAGANTFARRRSRRIAPGEQEGEEAALVTAAPPSKLGLLNRSNALLHDDPEKVKHPESWLGKVAHWVSSRWNALRQNDRSLWLFGRQSVVRVSATEVVDNPWFGRAVLALVLLNCVVMAMDDPMCGIDTGEPPGSSSSGALPPPPAAPSGTPGPTLACETMRHYLDLVNIIFTGIFTVEIMFQAVAKCFAFGPDAYLTSGWSWIDFVATASGYVVLIVGSSAQGVRALRALRPLRIMTSTPGMRKLVRTLLESIPMLFDQVLLLMWVFFVFGIISLEVFKGQLRGRCLLWTYDASGAVNGTSSDIVPGWEASPCAMGNIGWHCPADTNSTCVEVGANPNFGFTSFDNFGAAFVQIWEVLILDNWTGNILYPLMDVIGPGIPVVFCILLVLFGFYFAMQLLIAILSSKFAQMEGEEPKKRRRHSLPMPDSSEDEREVDALGRPVERSRAERMQRSVIRRWQRFKRRWLVADARDDLRPRWRTWFWDFTIRKDFNNFITAVILANVCTLSMEYYDSPAAYDLALAYVNFALTLIFILEFVLRHIGLGPVGYWSQGFNILDGIIVITSVAELALGGITGGGGSSQALRTFRLLRILRALRLLMRIESMRRLMNAIFKSFVALRNFLLLLLMFIFIFCILGMSFFGGTPPFYFAKSNMNNIWRAGYTIFQLMMGDDNTTVMINGMLAHGPAAALFFIFWGFFSGFILLTIFLAILITNFHNESVRKLKPLDEESSRNGFGSDSESMASYATSVDGGSLSVNELRKKISTIVEGRTPVAKVERMKRWLVMMGVAHMEPHMEAEVRAKLEATYQKRPEDFAGDDFYLEEEEHRRERLLRQQSSGRTDRSVEEDVVWELSSNNLHGGDAPANGESRDWLLNRLLLGDRASVQRGDRTMCDSAGPDKDVSNKLQKWIEDASRVLPRSTSETHRRPPTADPYAGIHIMTPLLGSDFPTSSRRQSQVSVDTPVGCLKGGSLLVDPLGLGLADIIRDFNSASSFLFSAGSRQRRQLAESSHSRTPLLPPSSTSRMSAAGGSTGVRFSGGSGRRRSSGDSSSYSSGSPANGKGGDVGTADPKQSLLRGGSVTRRDDSIMSRLPASSERSLTAKTPGTQLNQPHKDGGAQNGHLTSYDPHALLTDKQKAAPLSAAPFQSIMSWLSQPIPPPAPASLRKAMSLPGLDPDSLDNLRFVLVKRDVVDAGGGGGGRSAARSFDLGQHGRQFSGARPLNGGLLLTSTSRRASLRFAGVPEEDAAAPSAGESTGRAMATSMSRRSSMRQSDPASAMPAPRSAMKKTSSILQGGLSRGGTVPTRRQQIAATEWFVTDAVRRESPSWSSGSVTKRGPQQQHPADTFLSIDTGIPDEEEDMAMPHTPQPSLVEDRAAPLWPPLITGRDPSTAPSRAPLNGDTLIPRRSFTGADAASFATPTTTGDVGTHSALYPTPAGDAADARTSLSGIPHHNPARASNSGTHLESQRASLSGEPLHSPAVQLTSSPSRRSSLVVLATDPSAPAPPSTSAGPADQKPSQESVRAGRRSTEGGGRNQDSLTAGRQRTEDELPRDSSMAVQHSSEGGSGTGGRPSTAGGAPRMGRRSTEGTAPQDLLTGSRQSIEGGGAPQESLSGGRPSTVGGQSPMGRQSVEAVAPRMGRRSTEGGASPVSRREVSTPITQATPRPGSVSSARIASVPTPPPPTITQGTAPTQPAGPVAEGRLPQASNSVLQHVVSEGHRVAPGEGRGATSPEVTQPDDAPGASRRVGASAWTIRSMLSLLTSSQAHVPSSQHTTPPLPMSVCVDAPATRQVRISAGPVAESLLDRDSADGVGGKAANDAGRGSSIHNDRGNGGRDQGPLGPARSDSPFEIEGGSRAALLPRRDLERLTPPLAELGRTGSRTALLGAEDNEGSVPEPNGGSRGGRHSLEARRSQWNGAVQARGSSVKAGAELDQRDTPEGDRGSFSVMQSPKSKGSMSKRARINFEPSVKLFDGTKPVEGPFATQRAQPFQAAAEDPFKPLKTAAEGGGDDVGGEGEADARPMSNTEYMKHDAYWVLTPENPLRWWLFVLMSHRWFDRVTMFVILWCCVVLALDSPALDKNSTMAETLVVMNIVISAAFGLEMLIKLVVKGFILHPGAYWRNGWDVLDGLVTIISLVSLFFSSSDLSIIRALRALRALRPLRLITRWKGMRLVIDCLVNSLPGISQILGLGVFLFGIFAILGQQLFAGRLNSCNQVAFPDGTVITERSECPPGIFLCTADDLCQEVGSNITREWIVPFRNFDNVGMALMALFVVNTCDNMLDMTRTCMSVSGFNEVPVPFKEPWMGLYIVVFVFCSTIFWVNLLISVIIEQYTVLAAAGEVLASKQAKQWMKMLQFKASDVNFWKTVPLPGHSWGRGCYRVASHKWFDTFMMAVICTSIVVLTATYYGQSQTYSNVLAYVNIAFFGLFVLEAVVKISAMGFVMYIKDDWNRLDMFVIVVSIPDIVLTFMDFEDIGILTVLRIFRIARMFKLIRHAKGLRTLFNTLIGALPAIFNVGTLLLLVFYIYSVLGMNLFGGDDTLEWSIAGGGLGGYANFDNFGTSMLILFRVFTLDNWSDVMAVTAGCDANEYNCQWHSPITVLAVFFFITFILIALYVVSNLIIAVIIDNFLSAAEESGELKGQGGNFIDTLRHITTLRVFVHTVRQRVEEFKAAEQEGMELHGRTKSKAAMLITAVITGMKVRPTSAAASAASRPTSAAARSFTSAAMSRPTSAAARSFTALARPFRTASRAAMGDAAVNDRSSASFRGSGGGGEPQAPASSGPSATPSGVASRTASTFSARAFNAAANGDFVVAKPKTAASALATEVSGVEVSSTSKRVFWGPNQVAPLG